MFIYYKIMEIMAYGSHMWYNICDHERKIKLSLALHFV